MSLGHWLFLPMVSVVFSLTSTAFSIAGYLEPAIFCVVMAFLLLLTHIIAVIQDRRGGRA